MKNILDNIKYSVGEMFEKNIGREGVSLVNINDIPFCQICTSNTNTYKIEAVKRGDIVIEVRYVEDVVFMFLKIGNCLKYEIPFNLGEYTKFQSSSYERENCIMPIVLVDAEPGIIRAMRIIELNKELTEMICQLAFSDGYKTVSYHQRLKNVFERSAIEKLRKLCIIKQFVADKYPMKYDGKQLVDSVNQD